MTLLLDALDRTLKEPGCAWRWHAMMAFWQDTRDDQARASVLDVLEKMSEADARTDVLRLTFLACATADSRFESAAALKVLQLDPADPDRLAAYMAFQWLSALQYMEERSAFIAALSAGRVPEMAERLMRDAASLLPPGFKLRIPDDVRRVAVVAPYIGHQYHTPSTMAVEQCAILAREGCEVHLFTAQELMPPDASQFRGDGRELMLPPFDATVWGRLLPAGARMTVSDQRFSLPGRWRNLLPAMAEFDPDVVLLVGLFSPLAAALYGVRPVVGLSVNSVAPIAPVDVWLSANAAAERRASWGKIFPEAQVAFHPYRLRRSRRQYALTRAQFGFADSAVILITAGFRLEHEIKADWADRMLQLMEHHPQVVWLLVGGAGKLPTALAKAPANRVRVFATRDDVPGMLRISDIYVNPPRMGGGISVAEAMAEGLPVVSLTGSDGGDKAGEQALTGHDAYVERLAALIEDPAMRRDLGAAMRRRFDERFDLDASGPALLAACRQAAELSRERLTGSS